MYALWGGHSLANCPNNLTNEHLGQLIINLEQMEMKMKNEKEEEQQQPNVNGGMLQQGGEGIGEMLN